MYEVPYKQRILQISKITLVKNLNELSTELGLSKFLLESYIKQLQSEGENIHIVNGYVKYNPGRLERIREKLWN